MRKTNEQTEVGACDGLVKQLLVTTQTPSDTSSDFSDVSFLVKLWLQHTWLEFQY